MGEISITKANGSVLTLFGVPEAKQRVSGRMRLARKEWLDRSIERQGGLCYYCRVQMPMVLPHQFQDAMRSQRYRNNRPTLDHIIPLCAGGRDAEENTVAACNRCNGLKGDMMPWDFILLADMAPEPEAVGLVNPGLEMEDL